MKLEVKCWLQAEVRVIAKDFKHREKKTETTSTIFSSRNFLYEESYKQETFSNDPFQKLQKIIFTMNNLLVT